MDSRTRQKSRPPHSVEIEQQAQALVKKLRLLARSLYFMGDGPHRIRIYDEGTPFRSLARGVLYGSGRNSYGFYDYYIHDNKVVNRERLQGYLNENLKRLLTYEACSFGLRREDLGFLLSEGYVWNHHRGEFDLHDAVYHISLEIRPPEEGRNGLLGGADTNRDGYFTPLFGGIHGESAQELHNRLKEEKIRHLLG